MNKIATPISAQMVSCFIHSSAINEGVSMLFKYKDNEQEVGFWNSHIGATFVMNFESKCGNKFNTEKNGDKRRYARRRTRKEEH